MAALNKAIRKWGCHMAAKGIKMKETLSRNLVNEETRPTDAGGASPLTAIKKQVERKVRGSSRGTGLKHQKRAYKKKPSIILVVRGLARRKLDGERVVRVKEVKRDSSGLRGLTTKKGKGG